MKPSSVLLALLLLAGAVGGFVAWRRATEPARAWAEFLELDGVDLRGLEGRRGERARELFQRFLPIPPKFPPTPWIVLNLAAKGEAARPLMLTLDCSVRAGRIRQHVDAWLDRRCLGFGEWWHDANVDTVSAAYDSGLQGWCLVLGLSRAGERRMQIRAVPDAPELHVLPDEMSLLREEGEDGRAVPPSWSGPLVEQTEEAGIPSQDWSALLRRGLSTRLLARLCRLGRRDRPEEVLALSEVRVELEKLRTSTHPWIREAAELALRP